tara:strand:+ start:567 stop:989 length:423 start_codon:yes stop_codon:yes gene_type:complete
MAITYENVIYDRVIDSLHSLIANEFSIPIYFDNHDGNQSFLITPDVDSNIDTLATGQIREVTVNISYELNDPGNYTKNNIKQVTEIKERLKRLLHNNKTYYADSGENKYRNGIVQSINYEREDDISRGVIIFSCQTMELI